MRSQAAAQDAIGSPRAAEALSKTKDIYCGGRGFPSSLDGKSFGWDPAIQLFWDCKLLSCGFLHGHGPAPISRGVYVCSHTGDDASLHEARATLRGYGFEPITISEKKSLKSQRATTLRQHGLMEKAKGCDIALATRIVADAATDL